MTTAAAMAGLTEPGSWPLPPQLSSYPRNDPKPGREASSSAPPACPDPCQARERSSCICAAGLSLEGYLECCRGVIVPLGSTEQHGPTGRHRHDALTTGFRSALKVTVIFPGIRSSHGRLIGAQACPNPINLERQRGLYRSCRSSSLGRDCRACDSVHLGLIRRNCRGTVG